MSLDGIDYFPHEFASQDFIKKMTTRKAKNIRLLKHRSSTQVKDPALLNHNTTQQNDSVFEEN